MRTSLYLVFIVLCLTTRLTFGQAPDSTLTEKYLLDFVVPDMPAFKALGTDPSNILRPADAKKFAVTLSPFYSNGKAIIPKNFAVEFSPWKLASSKWTLESYNEKWHKRFLYRSSFSIGTIEDTTDFPNKLALGYRVSFLSKKADILTLADAILDKMQTAQVAFVQLTNYWVVNIVQAPIADRPTYYQQHRNEFNVFLSTLGERLRTTPDPALQALYDAFLATFSDTKMTNEEIGKFVESFATSVDKYIETFKEENWNASRLDFAIAWVGQSGNDELKGTRFSSFNLWLTWAIRAHKNGQLLLGTYYSRPKSIEDKVMTRWSANARYYIGTQAFRGFLEGQFKFEDHQEVEKSLLVNIGTELRIGSRFWVNLSGGLDNYLAESDPFSKLVSSIEIKYGFNDAK